MCGIGGIYRASDAPLPVEATLSLWEGLEARGTHASGFALQWVDSDQPIVVKQPGATGLLQNRLSEFMASGETTQYVLLHTRFTTQGSTKNNANNHPVVREGIILTHNGVLYNDREIFKTLGVSPTADVDTEAINAALRHESPGWTIDNIWGSMSIAWVDAQDDSNKVHLMTNGDNPLVIARTNDNHIVWASTLHILQQSDFEIKTFFHATPYKVYTLHPDGAIRSDFVSENRNSADMGWQAHRASRASYSPSTRRVGVKGKKSKKRAQNKRKGTKKGSSLLGVQPGPRILSQDATHDWREYMAEAGYVEVWRAGQWVWVPAGEVTL